VRPEPHPVRLTYNGGQEDLDECECTVLY
jgi:hypothetical protein